MAEENERGLACFLFELAVAAMLIYLPPLQPLFHTAPLGPVELAILAPFRSSSWGAGGRAASRVAAADARRATHTRSVVTRIADRCSRRWLRSARFQYLGGKRRRERS